MWHTGRPADQCEGCTFNTGHVSAESVGPIAGLLQPGATVAWVIV